MSIRKFPIVKQIGEWLMHAHTQCPLLQSKICESTSMSMEQKHSNHSVAFTTHTQERQIMITTHRYRCHNVAQQHSFITFNTRCWSIFIILKIYHIEFTLMPCSLATITWSSIVLVLNILWLCTLQFQYQYAHCSYVTSTKYYRMLCIDRRRCQLVQRVRFIWEQ